MAAREGAASRDQELVEAYRLFIADVYELAGTSRQVSDELARTEGQTAARWHLMSVLAESELSAAAAARRLGLARQSVQRVAHLLVGEGLLLARPDPDDRRAPLLSLSGTGRRAMEELFDRSHEHRVAALTRAGVTTAQLRQAQETLQTLTAALRTAPHDLNVDDPETA